MAFLEMLRLFAFSYFGFVLWRYVKSGWVGLGIPENSRALFLQVAKLLAWLLCTRQPLVEA